MKLLVRSELEEATLQSLALDPAEFALESPEAIATLIRRAASFLCPCAPRMLVSEVRKSLRGLTAIDGDVVEETLESLVAYGDLLELRESGQDPSRGSTTLIYLAPPAYVRRESGSVLLIGVVPDDISLLPNELEQRVQPVRYLRQLRLCQAEEETAVLRDLGFRELSASEWCQAPEPTTAEEHLALLTDRIEGALSSGEIEGLRVMDSSRPSRFYKGRWVEPGTASGRFVGRRPQAYGADLWCYVELDEGRPVRFVDFPLDGEMNRGCDEAWHLQAAIDAIQGQPQQYRVRRDEDGVDAIAFFSPLPAWARRRWDTIGSPGSTVRCFFSYELPAAELEEELRFAREHLWLVEVSAGDQEGADAP